MPEVCAFVLLMNMGLVIFFGREAVAEGRDIGYSAWALAFVTFVVLVMLFVKYAFV